MSKQHWRIQRCLYAWVIFLSIASTKVWALDLEWSGQFRGETHWIYNYAIAPGNLNTDSSRLTNPGYYVPPGGERNAFFQTLFTRLNPVVVVNDNIYLKSEWHVGDPIYGFFGSGQPYGGDGRTYFSTQTRSSTIAAQRFWAEFLSEVGTVQVGRAPLHWGLGVVWNDGTQMFDRYQSTGDTVRLISKFGSFSFSPAIVKYSIGNGIGGNCLDPTSTPVPCVQTQAGGGGLTDYSLAFKYENLDDDVEMGLNFIKRILSSAQGTSGYASTNDINNGANYNTWAIYGRKRVSNFQFGVEIPVTSGVVAGADYRTFAIALESDWAINDTWEMGLKAGHVPGQPNSEDVPPGVYEAFYFHPNYKVGLIMFNYQFRNFAGPNTLNNPNVSAANLGSPFDNPLANANYLAWTGRVNLGKWGFHTTWIYAQADEPANGSGHFFNHWTRSFVEHAQSSGSQSSSLGWEMDYGATFRWDDAFTFDFEFGAWFPGDYYLFDNTSAHGNTTLNPVFATNLRVGVQF